MSILEKRENVHKSRIITFHGARSNFLHDPILQQILQNQTRVFFLLFSYCFIGVWNLKEQDKCADKTSTCALKRKRNIEGQH